MKKIFQKTPLILFCLLILLCLFSPGRHLAAEGEYILLEALPVPGASAITETSNIGQYLNGVFRLGIGLASVLAVLMITIGGLQYMTSDKIQLKTDSKTTISNALWGLVLVLASFLLLKTINTDLVEFNFDLKPVISEYESQGITNVQIMTAEETKKWEETKDEKITQTNKLIIDKIKIYGAWEDDKWFNDEINKDKIKQMYADKKITKDEISQLIYDHQSNPKGDNLSFEALYILGDTIGLDKQETKKSFK